MKKFKMLIALAGGPDAEKVALSGLLFGKPLNAEITLLSIVKPTKSVSDDGTPPAEISSELKRSYEKSLNTLAEKIFKDYPVITRVEEGKPNAMILKIARDWQANVIVIGINSAAENSRFSVTTDFDEIVKKSEIPLILVPLQ